MNYLNITKYIYLIVGAVMTYDAISKWNEPEKPWLQVIIAATAFFTYFFRSHFAKKFEERKNQNQKNSQENQSNS
ncbi:hypothetical protein [Flavobacterium sp.]|jgi:phosphotransferase system  glucose/maltose/N-acetylglucosamine-specific IIC component|uniref:hypothetical protein n=1 Tax=Flavobacterium sp. TaxID=239 RepID=UPI003751220A